MKRNRTVRIAARGLILVLLLSLLLPLCSCAELWKDFDLGALAQKVHETLHPQQYMLVTFVWNDESQRSEERLVRKGTDICESAPAFTRFDMDLVGWSLSPSGELFHGAPQEGMKLYAIWEYENAVTYKTEIPETLEHARVVIDVRRGSRVLSGRKLSIGSTCKELIILSDGRDVDDFSITVSERSEDLSLRFTDLRFTSYSGHGIGASNYDTADYAVTVSVSGECSVALREDGWRAELPCGSCLSIPRLSLCGDGSLTVAGADRTRREGDRLYNGVNGGYAIFAESLTVRDITLSALGGNAGSGNTEKVNFYGGDGGDAVFASEFTAVHAKLILTGGIGGASGVGTHGEKTEFSNSQEICEDGHMGTVGGRGGHGMNVGTFTAKNSELLLTGGKGGKGGNGGSGGSGYGGDSFASVILCGDGGRGGWGGEGGYGAFAGVFTAENSLLLLTGGNGGEGGNGGSAGDTYRSVFGPDVVGGTGGKGGTGGEGGCGIYIKAFGDCTLTDCERTFTCGVGGSGGSGGPAPFFSLGETGEAGERGRDGHEILYTPIQ